ncbi:PREDICTED: probable NADH dehydrogenase [ubiquinone] iron-sulfur protein 6, mitochondrial [Papilio polytes]|uniref:probable NADH dehydrogenase [ubiquinone] iron-sulfur protein 6, mitochondrial n=1 Tax=Papilio polytes TaxID=76194 RepID=UPI000676A1E3|nr:PREDICTED: probable NADH dehydrogenase [ubiquinone] iron-sulfur protein 6, mitochondrial [Papilio polytes]
MKIMTQKRAALLLFQHFNRNKITAYASRCITNTTDDICTHTGQKWDSDDYRLARFMNAPKHVNQNWAVKLISEVPPKEVTERVVWCDGGSGPEGHPRVYINLDKPGDHSCGYCGLRFIKKESH